MYKFIAARPDLSSYKTIVISQKLTSWTLRLQSLWRSHGLQSLQRSRGSLSRDNTPVMNNKQCRKNWCSGPSSSNLCKDHVDHCHKLQRLKSESGKTFQKRQVSIQFSLKFCQDSDHEWSIFLPSLVPSLVSRIDSGYQAM